MADLMRQNPPAEDPAIDPFCLLAAAGAAWTRYAAGDYDAAIARCRHTLEMYPDYVVIRRLLGAAQLEAGRAREGLATLEGAVAVRRADPVTLSWLAHARAVTGARAEARALIDRIRTLETATYVPHYHLALAHTGLDDHQRAFELLGKALHDRDPMLTTVAVEPRFAPLRDDARYVELLQRLNMRCVGKVPGVEQAGR